MTNCLEPKLVLLQYDFENLVGSGFYTINITGGEGRFIGAKGILTFSETNVLSPDPTAPINGWMNK
ncbi:MAG: hypothetical protein KME30_04900 [Iphinoe sp. HA4291-MV1]|nr:hypothetical protein [Iphinoe sp. HA4291-MV1]